MTNDVLAHGVGWSASVKGFDIACVEQKWTKQREGLTERIRNLTADMLIETAIQAGQGERIDRDSLLVKDSSYVKTE